MSDWHRPPPRGSYMFILQLNKNFWLRPKFVLVVRNSQWALTTDAALKFKCGVCNNRTWASDSAPKFTLVVWNLQRCRPFFLFRYWFLGPFVDSELKFARHFCDMVRRNKEYESNQGENHELILRRAISARPIRKAPWANCGPVFFMFRRSIRS